MSFIRNAGTSAIFITTLFLNSCTAFLPSSPDYGLVPEKTEKTTRIAFGSCNKVDHPQPLWAVICKTHPDLWIWAGDAIYANTTDSSKMAEMFKKQKNIPSYQKLVAACPVIGTWDDHDFGANNALGTYPMKKTSQSLFLDFLDEPSESTRRKQKGIYTSYTFGTEARSVKIILLDLRYFREAPGPDADLLGQTQWQWLERELRESTARINLIISSTQILAESCQEEKWTDYPASLNRLYAVLARTRPAGLFVLSGDRHFGDISSTEVPGFGPLIQITSSGLTHHRNKFIHPLPIEYQYRVHRPFLDLNFGLIDVDWASNTVRMMVCDRFGQIRIQYFAAIAGFDGRWARQ